MAREAPDFDIGSIRRLRMRYDARGRWQASAQLDPPPIASSNAILLDIVKQGRGWRLVSLDYVAPGATPTTLAPVVVETP